MVKVITNNHPRLLLNWDELTPKEQADYKDITNHEEDDYVRYKGNLYSSADFMMPPAGLEWDGIHQDTFFSGILIKLVHEDMDYVIMGRFYDG